MISGVMHFFNEELLIGDWIDHHKTIFDHAVLIDHHSTDRSRKIAEDKLPEGWKIITSRLSDFDASQNDAEVMDVERSLPEGWKMALNTTEFIFHPNLAQLLSQLENEHPTALAFGSRAACLIDREELPIEAPIWKNRHHGILNYEAGYEVIRRWRFIHKAECGRYAIGRHDVALPRICVPDFLHLHFLYSPWPECKARKLQIQTRIPEHNKAAGLGKEHLTTSEALDTLRESILPITYDLLTNPVFAQNYRALLDKV